jgi:hypothetical protein
MSCLGWSSPRSSPRPRLSCTGALVGRRSSGSAHSSLVIYYFVTSSRGATITPDVE